MINPWMMCLSKPLSQSMPIRTVGAPINDVHAFRCLTVDWLATLVITTMLCCSVCAHAAKTNKPGEMTITVTDLGINQKTSALEKLGAKAIQWVLGRLKDEARIAVVMPDPKQVTGKTNQELRHQIFQNLKERVDRALKDGHEQIEIQLVQDINAFGYVSLFPFEDRQHQVDQFGEAAYGAIADITAYLRQNNVQTHNHAILGSNGAKVFAHNVAAWSLNGKSIWEKVDFFDGRAHLTSIVMAITRIGADRVRIFNTAGDLWAPFTAWGFQSIGNRDTSRL